LRSFLEQTQESGGVSMLLIRKFREAFKISFSVGAVVSRVVLFTGESRDILFLLRKKKEKKHFLLLMAVFLPVIACFTSWQQCPLRAVHIYPPINVDSSPWNY